MPGQHCRIDNQEPERPKGPILLLMVKAILAGMLIALAGTIPRNLLFAANLRYQPNLPWAIPLTCLYLWFYWRYLAGAGPPQSTADERRRSLRANRVPARLWSWALLAGGSGVVALVLALGLTNRLIVLPQQHLPNLAGVPKPTVLLLLLAAAPIAGVIEEAAFRGYMQGPIEKRYGLLVAILATGTMFAAAHLDFQLVLWPYYVAVAAIYGTVTSLTNSILPAIVLHTGGNLYSNLDLWLHGKAEWQARQGTGLIWTTGADSAFWVMTAEFLAVTAAMLWTFSKLARAARECCLRPLE